MHFDSSKFESCRVRRGFTFIEIMVVVIIIGLLAGAVGYAVYDKVDMGRKNRAKQDISTIHNAIESYRMEHGRLPASSEGLSALGLTHMNDPWGRPYQYNVPGRDGDYEVVSYGADGREGGEDENADIGSWSLAESSAPGAGS